MNADKLTSVLLSYGSNACLQTTYLQELVSVPLIGLNHYFPQETHKMYLQKLDEISKHQNNCSTSISRQRKKLKETSRRVKK